MKRYGIMLEDAKLLGTSLALQKGQLVELTEAANLPQGGWFARPADGKWSDKIERGESYSILLTWSGEFEFVPFGVEVGGLPIILTQQNKKFSVQYGLQEKTDLFYSEACVELGVAIMHALCCEGKIKQ